VQLVPTQTDLHFQLNMALFEQHWQPGTRGLMLALSIQSTPSNPTPSILTDTAIAVDELQQYANLLALKGRGGLLMKSILTCTMEKLIHSQ
jgi:aspartate/methionine/tyrosine aminotransferase